MILSKTRGPRRAGVVLAALALSVVGGPRPAQAADSVATVNGESISSDEFEDTLAEIAAAGFIQLQGDGAVAAGNDARLVLGEMISNVALRQALEAAGVDTAEGSGADDEGRPALLRDGQRYRSLLEEAGMYDLSDLRDEYEESSGVANGQICALVMLPADEDAAGEALAALEDGDFNDVASDLGIQVGAVSGNPSAPCTPVDGLPAELLDPLQAGLEEAGVGNPTDAIEIQQSTVIAMAPEFDDVAALLSGDVVEAAVDEILAQADVSVDARYGRWDRATQRVVPLSTPQSITPSTSAPTSPS